MSKLMSFIDHLTNLVLEIPYYIHSSLGFTTGFLASVTLLSQGEVRDVFVSFIIGVASAIGAAGTKWFISLLKEKTKRKRK